MVGEFLKPVLTLDLIPGVRVGPFRLGMPIREACNIIQRGSRAIRRAQLKYCKEAPLSTDIIIDLFQDGILLRFEPVTQRLRTIEIYNAQKLRLAYGNGVFSAPNMAPTFVRVYNHFGPSYPGKFDEHASTYFLHYPGLEFQFRIPEQFAELYRPAGGASRRTTTTTTTATTATTTDLPVEFPDGTTPVAQRVCVYKHEVTSGGAGDRGSGSGASAAARPPSPPPLPAALLAAAREMDASVGPGGKGDADPATRAAAQATAVAAARLTDNLYFEEVVVRLGQGLEFVARSGARLTFESSVQDVLVILGPPNRVFDKAVDKMKIHAASSLFAEGGAGLGDGGGGSGGGHHELPSSVNSASSVAAAQAAAAAASAAAASGHAAPCADYFYNYFDLGMDVLFDGDSHLIKKFVLHTNFPGVNFPRHAKCNFRIELGGSGGHAEPLLNPNALTLPQSSCIGPDTRFDAITKIMGDCGQPVVHNRGLSHNPFGSVLFYGLSNVIFEVDPVNQHISSVTLFNNNA